MSVNKRLLPVLAGTALLVKACGLSRHELRLGCSIAGEQIVDVAVGSVAYGDLDCDAGPGGYEPIEAQTVHDVTSSEVVVGTVEVNGLIGDHSWTVDIGGDLIAPTLTIVQDS